MGKAAKVMDSNWGWAAGALTGIPLIKPAWDAASSLVPDAPRAPGLPPGIPPPANLTDESIKNAKLMERRRQLGFSGRQSTWLTGARGDLNAPTVGRTTLLGS